MTEQARGEADAGAHGGETTWEETRYTQRSDSTARKMALLEAAHRRGDYRLAMALADSLKAGLDAEWRLAPGESGAAAPRATTLPASAASLTLDAGGWRSVTSLPQAWARWAAGWEWCQMVRLSEAAGIARQMEPVDVAVQAPAAWCASLERELRVAQVDVEPAGDAGHPGVLVQLPCQVYGERRTREHHSAAAPAQAPEEADTSGQHAVVESGTRAARLVWQATVPANGEAWFVVFCGNPAAEVPEYASDLQARGEGYALEVESAQYVASLSAQTGQLERLRYKWRHGQELFAGGEGHGEPPHIDWAHDYLAAGKFQKFRITNWDHVPNYEVVRGPVCTIVRRWGFPHSPLHPVFTAPRMLVDVTYVFYAGVPYFTKHGTMEVVRDFSLNYLRDDEWVFSGYSFTDHLWMDESGAVHEGAVPKEHAERMWGVGFFHRQSTDAFFSIRLDHSLVRVPEAGEAAGTGGETASTSGVAVGGDAGDAHEPLLRHADAPALVYPGHGQLWSRWALRGDPHLRAGDTLRQHNAYVVEPYGGGPEAAAHLEAWRRRLLAPLRADAVAADAAPWASAAAGGAQSGAQATGTLAGPGEGVDCREQKAALWRALREVPDDMFYTVHASVADLGYVYDLRLRDGTVELRFTMPHRGRPQYRYLGQPAARRLEAVAGVRRVVLTPVWEPAWTPDRMSDAAWAAMGLNRSFEESHISAKG